MKRLLVLILVALALALATAAYTEAPVHAGRLQATSQGAFAFYEPDVLCFQGCSIAYFPAGVPVEVDGFVWGPCGELYAVSSLRYATGPYPPFTDSPSVNVVPVYVPVSRLTWPAPRVG